MTPLNSDLFKIEVQKLIHRFKHLEWNLYPRLCNPLIVKWIEYNDWIIRYSELNMELAGLYHWKMFISLADILQQWWHLRLLNFGRLENWWTSCRASSKWLKHCTKCKKGNQGKFGQRSGCCSGMITGIWWKREAINVKLLQFCDGKVITWKKGLKQELTAKMSAEYCI